MLEVISTLVTILQDAAPIYSAPYHFSKGEVLGIPQGVYITNLKEVT
jgi:hypothetical protein